MNSSGIKRGLATTAITALAVTGIPFIATSASAATGDSLSVLSVGPIRNGNAAGGSIILKSNSDAITPGEIRITSADYTNPVAISGAKEISSPAFDVDVKSFTLLDGDTTNAAGTFDKFADGTYHYELLTAVTLGSAAKATFGVVEDNAPAGVNADDPKTVVEVTPTGAPATVEVSPASQTTATDVQSGEYTVTVKDGKGFVTQLVSGEAFAVTSSPDGAATGALDDTTLNDGVATFTATAPTAGTKTLVIKGNGATGTPATLTANATLTVLAKATITEDEFDLVTGADTYESPEAFGGTYAVRVDQDTITFNFTSKDTSSPADGPDDAGKVVLLTLTGTNGLKFDGKTSKVYSVVLGADGKGSLSVKPTGVSDAATFTFAATDNGIASTTVTYDRAGEGATVAAKPAVYVTKVGSATNVIVKATDKFGNPVSAPTQVSITRGVRNGATETARQTVGADGTATFTLPDAGTVPGTENFGVNVYDDQFDASAAAGTGGTINYTADGLGADFVVTGATADPATTVITPLYDATSSAAASADTAIISIAGATANTPAKITVDNGALVLLGGTDDTLDEGSASDTITLTGGTGSVRVVGTKTGVVTVTVENAGRVKTVKLTVKQPTDAAVLAATARNIELEGPESVLAGDVATYTATATDAFGNPVPGVDDSEFKFTVSGPGNLQNLEGATDANGEIEQTVLLTDNADGNIDVKVDGDGAATQFGSAANKIDAANAPGLSASMDVDSVTSEVVNIEALEQAVADAEEKLAEANANLAAAQADLDVAQAQLAVAQAEVDRLSVRKAELRQKLNKAKENGNRQKAKTTRKKLRAVKRELNDANSALTVAQTRVDAQQAVVDIRQGQVDKAQENLDQAEADLEEAQN